MAVVGASCTGNACADDKEKEVLARELCFAYVLHSRQRFLSAIPKKASVQAKTRMRGRILSVFQNSKIPSLGEPNQAHRKLVNEFIADKDTKPILSNKLKAIYINVKKKRVMAVW